MKFKRFSIIEMLVVISIILILIVMAFPYIKGAQIGARKTATRNHLNQLKVSISSYLTDFKELPLSNHINSSTFTDTTAVNYWTRIRGDFFKINAKKIDNAELIFDKFENQDLSVKNENDFKVKYPSKSIFEIPLHSWYSGVNSPIELEDEELRTVSHSSRFLNFYISGTGFQTIESSIKTSQNEFRLGDENTSFKPSFIKSGLIKNYLFAYKNDTIIYTVPMKDYTPAIPDIAELGGKEFKVLDIVPVEHFGLNNATVVTYTDLLPKILGFWNKQHLSNNLVEDSYRRLYVFNDETKPVPTLTSEFSAKYKTLASDKIILNKKYSAKGINYSNTHMGVYMKAHVNNVKQIIDNFNSPIVYITFANQRKESAKTFKSPDPKIKDISLSSDSFILYSLGPNKTDDSDLGENHLSGKGTGDDIIEASGTTMSSEK